MEQSIREVLHRRADRRPNAPFVKCGGNWLTAEEVDAASDRVARGLADLGVGKGDRVALLIPNRQEMIELFFACAKLGAIQVPLNVYLKGEFLRYQLEDCGASALVVDEAGYRSASPIVGSTGVRHIVLLDDPVADTPLPAAAPTVPYRELSIATGDVPDHDVQPTDIFGILYTSGTTGLPKGCMLPQRYFALSARYWGPDNMGWTQPGDRYLTAFPLFHIGGQVVAMMNALVNDASVCLEPSFSASTFLGRAVEEQATIVLGVGAMAMALLARPPASTDRTHGLRLACFAPLPPETQHDFENRFGVPILGEGYGQTECNPIALSPAVGERNRASCGPPVPDLDVRVVDELDQELPAGQIGEIVVRPRGVGASTMFAGYWKQPEATLELWRGLWHHTGDYGRFDERGFLLFIDRKKDALRRRGENVSSHELESAIVLHPDVAEVAVCAVPSPLGEDDIKACIVARPGATLDPKELFAYFAEHLPYFAIPRYVEVRDSLPTTNATHRVMKQQLRDEGVTERCWDFEALGLSVDRADRRG